MILVGVLADFDKSVQHECRDRIRRRVQKIGGDGLLAHTTEGEAANIDSKLNPRTFKVTGIKINCRFPTREITRNPLAG